MSSSSRVSIPKDDFNGTYIEIRNSQHSSIDVIVSIDIDEPMGPGQNAPTFPTTRTTKYHIYADWEIPLHLLMNFLTQRERDFICSAGHLFGDVTKNFAKLELELTFKKLLNEKGYENINIFEIVRGFSFETSKTPLRNGTFPLDVKASDVAKGNTMVYDCFQFKITTTEKQIGENEIEQLRNALLSFCNYDEPYGDITADVKRRSGIASHIIHIAKPKHFVQVYRDGESLRGRVIYPTRPPNLVHDYVIENSQIY